MFAIIKKLPKLQVIGVILSVVIVAVFVLKPFKKKDIVNYSFSAIDVGDVIKTVSTSGKLEVTGVYVVSSLISGEISELNTTLNKVVKAGDILAVIDSPEAVEDLEKYSDTHRFAQLDLKDAKDLYITKQELFRDELISRKEYEDSKIAYERSLSNYKSIQATYEEKKMNLASRFVKAPIDGIVLESNVSKRSVVSSGNVLFEIVPSLNEMQLIVNVDESDVGAVKVGMKVEFSVSAYPDDVFEGSIVQLKMTPVIVDGITMYQTIVKCKNKDNKLRPGMNVTATIKSANVKDVLRVPNQAFYVVPVGETVSDKEKVIWLKKGISGDQFERVIVDVELIGDSYTQIKSDKIKKGDEVLVSVSREK